MATHHIHTHTKTERHRDGETQREMYTCMHACTCAHKHTHTYTQRGGIWPKTSVPRLKTLVLQGKVWVFCKLTQWAEEEVWLNCYWIPINWSLSISTSHFSPRRAPHLGIFTHFKIIRAGKSLPLNFCPDEKCWRDLGLIEHHTDPDLVFWLK